MHAIREWVGRAWLVLAVAIAIAGVDQWTKEMIRGSVALYDYITPIPSLAPYLLFEHVPNYGAAFGILQGQGWFFIIVAGVVTLGILIYVWFIPPGHAYLRLLLGMQMGGAMGNVIDRLNQGYVTDYVKIGVPGVYYWPNFNVADAAIVVGVILLGLYVIWQDVQMEREKRAAAQESARSTVGGEG